MLIKSKIKHIRLRFKYNRLNKNPYFIGYLKPKECGEVDTKMCFDYYTKYHKTSSNSLGFK